MARKQGNTRLFRLNNLTGGMNTISELNAYSGLDPNANLGAAFTQIQCEMINQENWFPSSRGGLSKEYGFTLHHNAGAGLITGLWRFIQSDGDSYFLYTQGNTLYSLSGGVATSQYTSLANNAYVDFTNATDLCVLCDGTNAPVKFDGASVSSLGGSPPSGAKQSVFYKNRLWVFSATSNQSLLYYSDANNIEAGYASNFVQCDVNDGQKITGIAEFYIPGQLEPVILVTKERSVGIVTGDGTGSNPFTFQKVLFNNGNPAFRAIIQYRQDIAFLTNSGISSYLTAMKDINLAYSSLTEKIRNQFSSLNTTNIVNSLAWIEEENNRIGFAIPQGNSTYPNQIWYYDYELRSWYKKKGFNITAVLVDTDGTVYHGDDTGKIYVHNTSEYAYADSAIVATCQTPYFDFFDPKYYKRIKEATVTARGNGAYSFSIGSRINYGKGKAGSTSTISLTSGSYTWGGGVWTSDAGVYQWGGAPLLTKKFYPKEIFRNISLLFTNSGADQPVDIVDVTLEVEYLNLT